MHSLPSKCPLENFQDNHVHSCCCCCFAKTITFPVKIWPNSVGLPMKNNPQTHVKLVFKCQFLGGTSELALQDLIHIQHPYYHTSAEHSIRASLSEE